MAHVLQLPNDGGNGKKIRGEKFSCSKMEGMEKKKKKIKGKEIGCSRMEGMEKNKGKN
jgi:hypothetical protein